MASKDLINRIQEAFKDPETVNAAEYQKIIEYSARKIADNFERMLFILVGLIALFVLIAENQIGGIKVDPFELKEFSVLEIVIPLLFSYIHFNLVTSLSKFEQLSVFHKTIIKKRHYPIYEHRLTEYFLPTPNLYDYKYFSKNEGVQRIQIVLWAFQFFSVTLIMPLLFQGYAFYKLIFLYGAKYGVLIGISLGIAIIFGLQSFFTVVTLLQDSARK